MSKKKRRPTNIDEDQAIEIEQMQEARRLNFSALVRILLDEAIAHRKGLSLTPSETVSRFEDWGVDGVRQLAVSCLEYLQHAASTPSSDADRFLKDLHHQKIPSDESIVLLADNLDIPVEDLLIICNCFLKEVRGAGT